MTLARLSLPLPCVVLLAGCFDPPPEYKVEGRVPPVIDSRGVDPVLTDIVGITPSPQTEIVFTAPFRSDDAGEDLSAFFIQDIPQHVTFNATPCQTCDFIEQVTVKASSLPFNEQTGRAVKFTWVPGMRTGCTTVTLILSHRSNFVRGWQMEDPSDSAQVTWHFQFLDPSGTGGAAVGCSAGSTP